MHSNPPLPPSPPRPLDSRQVRCLLPAPSNSYLRASHAANSVSWHTSEVALAEKAHGPAGVADEGVARGRDGFAQGAAGVGHGGVG